MDGDADLERLARAREARSARTARTSASPARTARSASFSWATGKPKVDSVPRPLELHDVAFEGGFDHLPAGGG